MNSPNPEKPDELRWRVAQACNGGACIRVASSGNIIFLGDSKNPDGHIQRYTRSEWDEFVTKIKLGGFDWI